MARCRVVRRPADDPGHQSSPRRELLVVHAPSGGALRVSGIHPRGGARAGGRMTVGGGLKRAGGSKAIPGAKSAELARLDARACQLRGPRTVLVPGPRDEDGARRALLDPSALDLGLEALAQAWGARRRAL